MKIDACKYGLSTLPITMAFGYILNAMERLARWGVLLGAQPKQDVEDTHTHTLTCRVGVPRESTAVLQDQLLAGCWRGHAASSVQGGRSINADCRGVQHTKHTLTYMVGAGVATHVPTHPLVIFYFL